MQIGQALSVCSVLVYPDVANAFAVTQSQGIEVTERSRLSSEALRSHCELDCWWANHGGGAESRCWCSKGGNDDHFEHFEWASLFDIWWLIEIIEVTSWTSQITSWITQHFVFMIATLCLCLVTVLGSRISVEFYSKAIFFTGSNRWAVQYSCLYRNAMISVNRGSDKTSYRARGYRGS